MSGGLWLIAGRDDEQAKAKQAVYADALKVYLDTDAVLTETINEQLALFVAPVDLHKGDVCEYDPQTKTLLRVNGQDVNKGLR